MGCFCFFSNNIEVGATIGADGFFTAIIPWCGGGRRTGQGRLTIKLGIGFCFQFIIFSSRDREGRSSF
jgi:hypothetical protein